MKFKKITSLILTAAMAFTMAVLCAPEAIVSAEAAGEVNDVNPWGTGGQITIDLSGCSGYETITVVVEFQGTVTSASGWGFDTYTIDGNRVTAVVSASGPNFWGFDSNVGIQVEGSGITGASLISVEGSGTHAASSSGGNGGGGDNGGSSPETTPAPPRPVIESNAVQGDDWLTTDGDRILDMNGNEVWLTGLSWFGYNTGSNLFDGVWNCNLREALEGIADHGFNLMRVPISAELLLQWKNGQYPEANYNHAYNSELESMNSLEIWDYVLSICEANGIKVMLDIHSVRTDAMGHMAPLWYSSDFTEEQYFEALDWVSQRYANNDTIIAYDLKNEPHGKASESERAIWNGSTDDNNWRYAAERAGNIILDNNPHALIVIEGIEIYPIDPVTNDFTSTDDEDYYYSWWGGNLRAVADYPIDFGSDERNAQIVYSPHDYGPAVYAQPWFEGGFTYRSLIDDYWEDSWLYIDEQQIAPLLIGEWGGFMTGDNLTWMQYMRQLIAEHGLNHTFWCYNANSGDTGGLVTDDFVTWDTEKYEFVREVLWQDEDGNFIGLDHEVPLGTNGISLGEWSGDVITPVLNETAESSEVSSSEEQTTDTGEETDQPGTSASSSPSDQSTTIFVPEQPSEELTVNKDPLKTAFRAVIAVLIIAAVAFGGIIVFMLGQRSGNRKDSQV